MFKITDRTTDTCLGLKVEGKLEADDYKTLRPILDNAIKAQGTINLVLKVEEFEGYQDLDAIVADAKMTINEFSNISRVAIVSDTDWQEAATKLVNPLTPKTQLEHFELDETDDAWTWACGESWRS